MLKPRSLDSTKPTSIKTAQYLLIIKLAFMIAVFGQVFTMDKEKLEDANMAVVLMNFGMAVLPVALALFFIKKRMYWPTIIMCFFILWLSSIDMIQLVLSFATLLFLFNRKSRNYLRGEGDKLGAEQGPIEVEAEVDPDEAGAEDGAEAEQRRSADAEALPDGETQPQQREVKQSAAAPVRTKAKPSAAPTVEIREATPDDAGTIHQVMLEAFEEFRAAVPPSSALEETEEGIREGLASGSEFAAIVYEDNIPSAMVRYRFDGDAISFFRLSVVPSRRKRGLARMLVEWIERMGVTKGMNRSTCMVRQSVHRNLVLYENMGYEVVGNELFVRPQGTVKALKLEKKIGI
ncbi:GNAT family N-acetyltransferase [Cohnella fermenti]|uniref:GNAT family N-acetyltransferase n=1 Tax=Cohnella fermenti TaxID=2565925 RepID=A0A4S4BFF4_9BACL|nr:GNAT family N-acetyltransferase [Cohnella fermenti]THF73061.1 GNAT family N-acetyltransferase [Cohnella fermenti]